MLILSLDISFKCGWAVLEHEPTQVLSAPTLKDCGVIEFPETISQLNESMGYPYGLLNAVTRQVSEIIGLVTKIVPDIVVIEETNMGRSRYTQKALEWLHHELLPRIATYKVVYLSSSQWRKSLDLRLSKIDKKSNFLLKKANKIAQMTGEKIDKKKLGVKGRVGKKHLSVRYCNEHFGLNLKMKDNDIADAICLGVALVAGAQHCDGK